MFQNSIKRASLSVNCNIFERKILWSLREVLFIYCWKKYARECSKLLFLARSTANPAGCLFPNSHDNELKLLDHSIVTKFWKHSDEPRHIKLAKHDCKEGFTKDVKRLESKRDAKKRLGEWERVQANAEDFKIGTCYTVYR